MYLISEIINDKIAELEKSDNDTDKVLLAGLKREMIILDKVLSDEGIGYSLPMEEFEKIIGDCDIFIINRKKMEQMKIKASKCDKMLKVCETLLNLPDYEDV